MTTTEAPTIINGIDVDRLYVDSIDSKPVDFDFDYSTNIHFADEGTWQCWEQRKPYSGDETECEECCETIQWDESGWHHLDAPVEVDDDEPFGEDAYDHEPAPDQEWLSEGCDGPMMNYYYPIDLPYRMTENEAAEILADTCLVLVEVNGHNGLALAGGGMDLSWQICEAFMLLGLLPPAHFVRSLPKMAEPLREMHLLVLAGARRTLAIQRDWAEQALVGLDDVEAWFRDQPWRRQ